MPQPGVASPPETGPTARNYGLWLLLSALPSGFLLTVTNFIALEVGSFPMVWVFPLALYLGSFVVTFRSHGGVPSLLGVMWPEAVILGFLLYFLPISWVGWFAAVVAPLLVLLAVCLVAHGELYERRPPVRFLTHYYLTMAVGGFLGGVAVSLAAPWLFSGLFEYPAILAGLGLTFWWCRRTPFLAAPPGWPGLLRGLRSAATIGTLGFLVFCLLVQVLVFAPACKFRHRNFYGIYRIIEERPSASAPAGLRKLVHGKTNHGAQFLDQEQRLNPASYYYLGGAIAQVIEVGAAPRRIAGLGLGAGAISAHCRTGDSLTFYEIDPDNEKIARTWFTFLDESQARVRVVPGDGRLSLNETPLDARYDIIIIDAFSGDGIPTHLLTREAMQVYLSRLVEDGLILFHISNRYYNLLPVVKATRASLNLAGAKNIVNQTGLRPGDSSSQCVVLARKPQPLQPLLSQGWVGFGNNDGLPEETPWTDDFINILAPLWANR